MSHSVYLIECRHDGVSSKAGTYSSFHRGADQAKLWRFDAKAKEWHAQTPGEGQELRVNARFGSDGAPHNHAENNSFWLRWDEDTGTWLRFQGFPNTVRDINVRVKNEAGALAARRDGNDDERFNILEYNGSIDFSNLLPPSEVQNHTGVYEVLVNGARWSPQGPEAPPAVTPIAAPTAPTAPKRKAPEDKTTKPTRSRSKKVYRISVESRTVGQDEDEDGDTEEHELTKDELKEFFTNDERFKPGKVKFEVLSDGQWLEVVRRNSVAPRIIELAKADPGARLHVRVFRKGTRRVGGKKKADQAVVTFVNAFTGEPIDPVTIQRGEELPDSLFPPRTLIKRAASKLQDVKAADVPKVEVRSNAVAERAVEGYTTMLFYPPVRILKAQPGGMFYDALANLMRFESMEELAKKFNEPFRAVGGRLQPVTTQEDFLALFTGRDNTDLGTINQFVFSDFDNTPYVNVPFLWVQDGVEMRDSTVPAIRKGARAKDDAAPRASSKKKKTPTAEAASLAKKPRLAESEYSSSASSSTPSYEEARSSISSRASEIMRSGERSVKDAIERSIEEHSMHYGGGATIRDWISSAEEDAEMSASVAMVAATQNVKQQQTLEDLVQTTTSPQETRQALRSFADVAGLEERQESGEVFLRRFFERDARRPNAPVSASATVHTGQDSLIARDSGKFVAKYMDCRRGDVRQKFDREEEMLRYLMEKRNTDGMPRAAPKIVDTAGWNHVEDAAAVGRLLMENLSTNQTLLGRPANGLSLEDVIKRLFDPADGASANTSSRMNSTETMNRRYLAIRGMVRGVLSLLEVLGARLIIHGDARPHNVMFQDTEGLTRPILVDWSLANRYSPRDLKPELPLIDATPSVFDRYYDSVWFIVTVSRVIRGRMYEWADANGLSSGDVDMLMNRSPVPTGTFEAEDIDRHYFEYTETTAVDAGAKEMLAEMRGTIASYEAKLGIAEVPELGLTPALDGRKEVAQALLTSREWLEVKSNGLLSTHEEVLQWVSEFDTTSLTKAADTVRMTNVHVLYAATVLSLDLVSRAYNKRIDEEAPAPLSYPDPDTAMQVDLEKAIENINAHSDELEQQMFEVFGGGLPDLIYASLTAMIILLFPRTRHSLFIEPAKEEGKIVGFFVSIVAENLIDYISTDVVFEQASMEEEMDVESPEDPEEKAKEAEEEEEEEAKEEEEEEEEEEESEEETVDEEGKPVRYLVGKRAEQADKDFAEIMKGNAYVRAVVLTDIFLDPRINGPDPRVSVEQLLQIIAEKTIPVMNRELVKRLDAIRRETEGIPVETFFWIAYPESSPSVSYIQSRAMPEAAEWLKRARNTDVEPETSVLTNLASWGNLSIDKEGKQNEFMLAFLSELEAGVRLDPRTPMGKMLGDWYKRNMGLAPKMLARSGLVPLAARKMLRINESKDVPSDASKDAAKTWKTLFGFDPFFVMFYFSKRASDENVALVEKLEREYYKDFARGAIDAPLPLDVMNQLSNALQGIYGGDVAKIQQIDATLRRNGNMAQVLDLLKALADLRSSGLVHSEQKTIQAVDGTTKDITLTEIKWGSDRKDVLRRMGIFTDFDVAMEEYESLVLENPDLEKAPVGRQVAWGDRRLPPPGLMPLLTELGVSGIPPYSFRIPPIVGNAQSVKPRIATSEEMRGYLNTAYTFGEDSQLARGIAEFELAERRMAISDPNEEDMEDDSDEDFEDDEAEDTEEEFSAEEESEME